MAPDRRVKRDYTGQGRFFHQCALLNGLETFRKDPFMSMDGSSPELAKPTRVDALWARLARLDGWLVRWGWAALLLLAVCYYATYYRSGINMGGEGGTVAVVAMRLLEGQRPFIDTFLGYNVLWFYPVAWLFSLTGPDYIALRIFFFAQCTLTGVLAFCIVRRATGRGWLSALAGAMVILVPGMLFRNYMGLLAVSNMAALLWGYVWPARSTWKQGLKMALAGTVLGITYLIRVELGLFFTVIFLGLAVLYPLGGEGKWLHRLGVSLAGTIAGIFLAILLHLPFYADARERGYDRFFLEQYTGFIKLFEFELKKEMAKALPPKPQQTAGASPQQNNTPAAKSADPKPSPVEAAAKDGTLQRVPLSDIFKVERTAQAHFISVIYLPVLMAPILVVAGVYWLVMAWVRRDAALKTRALMTLVSTGAALTLFPQYYFFRPDPPHLSEFMVPFMVALACVSGVALDATRHRGWKRVVGLVFLALAATHAGLYVFFALGRESAGTYKAALGRNHEFIGANNTRIWLREHEKQEVQALYEAIVSHSDEDDYVVCYPYSPTVNFMTNRRSYMHNLYVDNDTAPTRFTEFFLRDIQKYRPAIVVVDNRDINKSEQSRFRGWAAPSYRYLQENYHLLGTFYRHEVFVRPDKVQSAQNPAEKTTTQP